MVPVSATLPSLRVSLQSGRTVRGLFVCTYDASLCEFVATLGWDFLILDAEHGPIDTRAMEHIARACELRGTKAIARIPLTSAADVSRFLDAGACGVMVPMVDGPADARRAVELVKYPPLGQRGLGAPRSAGFGVDASTAATVVARANSESLVIVQIESEAAVEHAAEIAAVECVDVMFIGPADLSLRLGVPCEWRHPKFINAVTRVAAVAAEHGKVLGAYAASCEHISWYEDVGARFIASALEDVLMNGTAVLRGS